MGALFHDRLTVGHNMRLGLKFICPSRNSQNFMEPNGSLPCSQQPPLVHILSDMNLIHLYDKFSIPPFTSRYSFRFTNPKLCVHFCLLPCMLHTLSIYPWHDNSVQVIYEAPHYAVFSSFLFYSILFLVSNILHSTLFSNILKSMFLP
jgi:hypothetical protein